LFFNAVWHPRPPRRRTGRAGLLIPGLDAHRIRRESWRDATGPLIYLLAVPVALLSVPVALAFDLLLIVAYLLPGPDLRAEDAST